MISAAEVVYKYPQDITEIGDSIRRLREKRGISQDELGMRLDMKSSSVSRYERGEREMGITTFFQFMEALGAEPEDFFPKRLMKSKTMSAKKSHLVRVLDVLENSDIDLLLSFAERMKKEK